MYTNVFSLLAPCFMQNTLLTFVATEFCNYNSVFTSFFLPQLDALFEFESCLHPAFHAMHLLVKISLEVTSLSSIFNYPRGN